MYQPSTPPHMTSHSGRTALIYGVLVGLILGIIESGVIVLVAHSVYNSYGVLSIPLSFLLWIIAFLVTGALASKRTAKIATGALTGLWAGMVGGIITTVTIFATTMPTVYDSYDYANTLALILIYIIALILLALGLGTGLGALGGLIGQSFATNNQTLFHSYRQSDPPQQYRQSDPPQQYRQSDPPQQEQVQYQQINSSQQEQ